MVGATKRGRSSDIGSSPPAPSSEAGDLPPSSPPIPFSDVDDELGGLGDYLNLDGGDVPIEEEDQEGEDLYGDNLMDDYAVDEALDRYDARDIDDDEADELTAEQRRAAERDMALRDRREARRGQGGRAARRSNAPDFLRDDDEEMDDDLMDGGLLSDLTKRRTRRQYDERQGIDDADEVLPMQELSQIKAGSIVEWLAAESVRRSVAKFFKLFLLEMTDEHGDSVYGQRIIQAGSMNSESLEVSYVDLLQKMPTLAWFLVLAPAEMLAIFDPVALEVMTIYFPAYERIHSEIHVRITELPASATLRDLRNAQLNALVRVSGVVTRRSGVFPQLKYVKFDCGKCGGVLGPFYQDTTKEVKVSFCPNCSSKGPFIVNSEQEVTGIYRNNFDASLNAKNGFPVFSTVIEANYINKKEDLFAAYRLTEQDEREIREAARQPDVARRIIKSIAPSIYGHEDIKTAIALSLFGGVPKDVKRKHRIRGDINVLMLGDPGTAKSQFLKYVEKTAHRCVFTTGQGASAVGLTASVRKDPVTREWTLEGGALVLADKGVCLIDEFDKMNDHDRTSIHEAMEQQTISISKAGIVTTLQARCAIVAAANPIRGRYNPTIPFQQNVELTEPILSRFDVLCVVKDSVDPVVDEMLARFVIGSHVRSHPNASGDEQQVALAMPQDLLRKYIMYAREKVKPKLHNMDQEKLSKLFADLRRESLATGSFPVTVRLLESMIRMAEASAKMHLREYVRSDDIDRAIAVAVGSFISAQKTSIKRSLERGFRKYLTNSRDHQELLAFLLGQLVKDKTRISHLQHKTPPTEVTIQVTELEARHANGNITKTFTLSGNV
ncbi:DNA replication licensing factor mcm2 [Rhizoctonia solani AG-1 IA]|uniref:DNA replication licensing factor MCM2 n=1 Tax=Thanatephorus cucumeris (strain AG1-IA) TaxID=983506 RepID=L8X1V2_THACA|nr:DNA replication licensing factor mcm2 [Rhizoctonia solani AG-1 IA]